MSLDKIYKKLYGSTVELKSEVIELAAPKWGDFSAEANQIQKDFDIAFKKQLLSLQDVVVRHNDMIGGVAKSLEVTVDKYSSDLKELGIDYNSVPAVKIVDAVKQSILNKPKYFKSILDKLKSIV